MAIDVSKEQLIKLATAAEIMAVSQSTIYRWTVTGKIEAVRCGGQWRTSREAVARFTSRTPDSDRREVEHIRPHLNSKVYQDAMRDLAALGID